MLVLTMVAQILALGLGLGLAAIWPRDARPVLDRDSAINLVTGACLYAFKLLVGLTGIWIFRVGLVPTTALRNPLLQCLVAFLLLDFARYWLHRCHHRVRFLWFFHRVHHSARTLDSTTGFRMHAVDFVQLALLNVLLFGVLLDTSGWAAWVLPLALVPGILADALEHANLRWPPGWNPRGRYLFNNPLFHSWHHVRDAMLCDGNYANALPAWDLLFRSDVSQDEPPHAYGLVDKKDLANDLFGLQLLRRPSTLTPSTAPSAAPSSSAAGSPGHPE